MKFFTSAILSDLLSPSLYTVKLGRDVGEGPGCDADWLKISDQLQAVVADVVCIKNSLRSQPCWRAST